MSNDSKPKPECQTTKTFTVYVIRCKVTNMNYVGITGQQVEQRIRQHKRRKGQLEETKEKIRQKALAGAAAKRAAKAAAQETP